MTAVLFVKRLQYLVGALALCAACAAHAQNWPAQPVKIIAPVPAGGGVDLLARAIAQKLQEQWNQSVVVENKPGASALIGTDFVAKSTDGHTLLMGYSVLATNKYLVSKLPYDLDRDLAPGHDTGDDAGGEAEQDERPLAQRCGDEALDGAHLTPPRPACP